MMAKQHRNGLWAGLALWLICASSLFAAEPAKSIDFKADIQPLFAKYCYSCHAGEKQESNFRLDRQQIAFRGGDLGEPAILPKQGAASPLVKYIAGTGDLVMPPKGPKMTAAEVELVRTWIDQGANWPADADAALKLSSQHWSFQPIQMVPVPMVDSAPAGAGEVNPVDAFIQQKLAAVKLALSPPADRVTFIRRLYFDMLGLPPTPAEIQAFVADQDSHAYQTLVERVLASPRYGERWARHWLDVVRFAETDGFETNNERPNAWHYRDYVINAFNNDLPYDQFVFQQLAGDAVGVDAATGFLVGGPWDRVKSPDPVLTAMQRSDELSDMTNTTATTFLAMTVGCARCHNHKFDPILQTDYYSLEAVFAGVQHGDRPLSIKASPEQQLATQQAKERLEGVQQELRQLQSSLPNVPRGKVRLLDDEQLLDSTPSATGSEPSKPGVTLLAPIAGHGINPAGSGRGFRDDAGDLDRWANISGGRYTWWSDKPQQDLLAYHPVVSGKQRLWLSWGCGWETHSQDVQYLLDLDGDTKTTADQTLLVTIDQQRFASDPVNPTSQPLWSGFRLAGVYSFQPRSTIIVRSGKTGTAVTADLIALEELPADSVAEPTADGAFALPPLRPATNSRENEERFSPVLAKYVRMTILATNGAEPCIDELEIFSSSSASNSGQAPRNVAREGVKLTSSGDYPGNPIHQLVHLTDGKYGNSFSWISNTSGTGWVQVELAKPELIERVVWGRDREEKFKDRTATKYQIEVAVEPGQWQVVASSADRIPAELLPPAVLAAGNTISPAFGLTASQLVLAKSLSAQVKQLNQQLTALTNPPAVYAGRFEMPRVTHRLFRGDPQQPREVVAANCLSLLGSLGLGENATDQERRVALAKWIANPENPLTARVLVNRVWQHHFGTGLVDTPSDFGLNGTRPSHPELLDWLAQQFMQQGWSIKKLHRQLLLSQTYQQANLPQEEGLKVDAQARLLWRFPPHRLEAETIRDAVLSVTGSLDLQMGGPGWSAFKPNTNYVRVYDPKEEFGPSEWRRAIYMTKIRMRQDGVFGTFDCPDAGQIAPKRARSTTALQALSLFNSQFMLQQADLLAARLKREAGPNSAVQIALAFQLALGRSPAADEAEIAKELVQQHGLAALSRALFNSNEFLFLP